MESFLNFIRYTGLVLFGLAVILLMAAVFNFFLSFTEVAWLDPMFIRLYLFLAVTGILAYMLVRFRRRN